jgi:outer membrane protein OmpA-like peptidoglycan-associated protein
MGKASVAISAVFKIWDCRVPTQTSGWVLAMTAILIALAVSSALASFEDQLTGARAAGVDGAVTAMADDVFALYYNPAGTAFFDHAEAGAYYGQLYGGLSDNSSLGRGFLGYVQPFHGQAAGFSYSDFTLGGLYQEQTINLSYAFKLGDRLALGLTGRRYIKTYGHDFNTDNAELNGVAQMGVSDPVFLNGHQAQAWGGDLAALWRLGGAWRTGLMVRNVNEPNVALDPSQTDRAPRSWDWGLAHATEHHAFMLDLWHGRFTQMENRLMGGYEHWWGGRFALRVGGGFGDRDARQATAGVSFRLGLLQVDYGCMIPLGTIDGTVGTQQLSLIFRFRAPPAPVLQPVYDEDPILSLEEKDLAAKKNEVQVVITPTFASLRPGEKESFSAHVTGTPDARVVWSLDPPLGTLSQDGLYQAPAEILLSQDLWVTAQSAAAQPPRSDRVMIHLSPGASRPSPVLLDLKFNPGQFEARPEDAAALEKVALALRQYPQAAVVIEGHTDDRGSAADNQRLSERRAQAVRDQIIQRFGADPARLSARGCGSTRPLASNATAQGRRINRRVVAILVESVD